MDIRKDGPELISRSTFNCLVLLNSLLLRMKFTENALSYSDNALVC
ncbi:hypothetical protein FHR85_002166 [Alkalibacillus almallahensis]|nr:hypothetical protein [Alkalibacillus almallahensis]